MVVSSTRHAGGRPTIEEASMPSMNRGEIVIAQQDVSDAGRTLGTDQIRAFIGCS